MTVPAAGVELLITGSGVDIYARYGDRLGVGGEGAVWSLANDPTVVVKRYHDEVLAKRGSALRDKLGVMVAAAPDTEHLAWPLAVVYERSGDSGVFVGYAMAAVDLSGASVAATLMHAAQRRQVAPGFGVRHGVRTLCNLAAAFVAAHARGAVLGDVNESNVMVHADSTVTVIDCDSAQVSAGGRTFRCGVGKPQFTAPELVGAHFDEVDRSPASDVFAFAVLAFSMLTGGAHPFDGVAVDPDVEPPAMPQRIAAGGSLYFGGSSVSLSANPRVPSSALPARLQLLFARSLEVDPLRRPSMAEWHAALADVDAHLVDCDRVSLHAFDRRDVRCGWCVHADDGFHDVWGTAVVSSGPSQLPLPPVPLGELASPSVRRVPVRAAGSAAVVPPAGAASFPMPGVQLSAQPGSGGSGSPPPAAPSGVSASSWSRLALAHPVLFARHVGSRLPGWGWSEPRGVTAGGGVTRWWVLAPVFAALVAVVLAVVAVRVLVPVSWVGLAAVVSLWSVVVAAPLAAGSWVWLVFRRHLAVSGRDVVCGVGRVAVWCACAPLVVALAAGAAAGAGVLAAVNVLSGRYDR